MNTLLKRFLGNASGSTAIEYALIGSIVSIAIVAAVISIGNIMNTNLALIASHLN